MKKFYKIIFVIIFSLAFGLPDKVLANKTDSLRLLIKNSKEDTNKVKWYNELYYALARSGENNEELISSLDKALSLAEKLDFKKGLTYTYNNYGIYYKNLGNNEKALEYHKLSQAVATKAGDKKGMARSYNNIGLIYDAIGNYPEAISNYLLAIKYGEESKFKKVVSASTANMAIIYRKQGELDKSEKYFIDAQKIFKENKDELGEAYVYANLAGIYKKKGLYDKAEEYNNKALVIEEKLGDESGVAGTYVDIGGLFVDRARAMLLEKKEINESEYFNKGIAYFKKAEKIYIHHNEVVGMVIAWENLGETYAIMKNYNKALYYCQKSLDSARKHDFLEQMSGSQKALSEISFNMSDYKSSIKYYKEYIQSRDSLFNQENSKKIIQSQLQYQFDKKETIALAEQEKKDATNKEIAKRQKLTTYSVILVLLVVVVFSFFLYKRFRITKQQNKIIVLQKTIVEEKNKEIVDSINYAKYLQDAILPPEKLIKDSFSDSFVLFKPKDIVAGDFYWMEISEKNIFIAAADCTGHGVPGAMVSVVCSNALNRAVKEFKITEPGQILDKVRDLVLETFQKSESDVKDGMDISLAVINKADGVIKWAGANNPLWYVENNELKEIKANKQPIGKTDDPKPFTTHTFPLKQANCLYLFTDGYADQFGGPQGKKLKYKNLEALLLSLASSPMEMQKKMLEDKVKEWQGDLLQVDDILIIGIKIA